MKNFTEFKYSPADLESLTGGEVTASYLQSLRRRGILRPLVLAEEPGSNRPRYSLFGAVSALFVRRVSSGEGVETFGRHLMSETDDFEFKSPGLSESVGFLERALERHGELAIAREAINSGASSVAYTAGEAIIRAFEDKIPEEFFDSKLNCQIMTVYNKGVYGTSRVERGIPEKESMRSFVGQLEAGVAIFDYASCLKDIEKRLP